MKLRLPKFEWVLGRQQYSAYKKLCLYSFKLGRWGFDCYLLKYSAYTILDWHTDPVTGKHWRMNITLFGTCDFYCKKEIVRVGNFLHIFRPDLNKHKLIVWRRTMKLSFGAAKFDKI